MTMSVAAVWITDNFDTVVNWVITIAASIFPFIVPRLDKERIAARKNLFAGYSVFLVKVTFYYLALVFVSCEIGRLTSAPMFTPVPIVFGGALCISGGLRWSKQMDMLKKGKKHGRCWTWGFVIMPVVIQGVLYLCFMSGRWMPRGWIAGWVIGNLLPIVLAMRLVDDHDFFEYQQVDISLVGDNEKYTLCPEVIHDEGTWITVDREALGRTTKLSAANIKKIEYDERSGYRVSKAMSLGDKVFRAMICFCYMLMIGAASQFLLGAVVEQIVVLEDEIYLEQGESYQLDAVALNEKAGELSYSVSGSSEIVVSEKGLITVSSDLPEKEKITADITISDEAGNTADVKVIVKNDAAGK